jgi:hypothetical protein
MEKFEATEQQQKDSARKLSESTEEKADSKKTDEQIKKLEEWINYESTNFQWKKQGIVWTSIIVLIIVNIFIRNHPKDKSINYDLRDWVLFGVL